MKLSCAVLVAFGLLKTRAPSLCSWEVGWRMLRCIDLPLLCHLAQSNMQNHDPLTWTISSEENIRWKCAREIFALNHQKALFHLNRFLMSAHLLHSCDMAQLSEIIQWWKSIVGVLNDWVCVCEFTMCVYVGVCLSCALNRFVTPYGCWRTRQRVDHSSLHISLQVLPVKVLGFESTCQRSTASAPRAWRSVTRTRFL